MCACSAPVNWMMGEDACGECHKGNLLGSLSLKESVIRYIVTYRKVQLPTVILCQTWYNREERKEKRQQERENENRWRDTRNLHLQSF